MGALEGRGLHSNGSPVIRSAPMSRRKTSFSRLSTAAMRAFATFLAASSICAFVFSSSRDASTEAVWAGAALGTNSEVCFLGCVGKLSATCGELPRLAAAGFAGVAGVAGVAGRDEHCIDAAAIATAAAFGDNEADEALCRCTACSTASAAALAAWPDGGFLRGGGVPSCAPLLCRYSTICICLCAFCGHACRAT